MNAKFREFVKTGRGKLTVALGCLALSWIFLLWQFSGSIGDLMPGGGAHRRGRARGQGAAAAECGAESPAESCPGSSGRGTESSSAAIGARSATAWSIPSCATGFSRPRVMSSSS